MSVTTLAARVIESLARQDKTVALAESCTGGLVCARLTAIPGASRSVWGAAVAYQNDAKVRLLGLDREQLRADGPVSAATTSALARRIQTRARSDLGAAVTGWAGPEAGAGERAGTVYLAVASASDLWSRRAVYDGDRERVREAACRAVLEMLIDVLEPADAGRDL